MLTTQDTVESKLKIVAIGLYVPGSGFTRVLTSLFARLQNNYDIHWLAIAYKGPVIETNGYTMYPTNLEGGDLYAAYQMEALVKELTADFVFILNDFWMFRNYERIIKTLDPRPVTVAYIPLDGKIDNPKDVQDTLFLDELVCYTKFSFNQTLNAFSKLKEEKEQPRCHIIPHGTDLGDFYPLEQRKLSKQFLNRAAIKSKVFPSIKNVDDSFIVLNANRISERKALHLTIEGFAKFAKDKPNAYLCFHVPNTPEFLLNELRSEIEASDVPEQIILNPLGVEYVSNEALNTLYNACDVGVNTSMGEGWGMIAFEHGATGAAQIVPKHTACEELWEGNAGLLDVKKWKVLHNNPFTMGEVNADTLKDVLEQLYGDESHLLLLSEKAFNVVNSKAYDWNVIADSWNQLFQKAKQSQLKKISKLVLE
nr:glycosyltransferase family 4 protein [uncultured Psychroserpens sp.]